MQFINTEIKAGVWRGDLVDAGDIAPQLRITHLGDPLEGVVCEHDTVNDVWRVTAPIPPALISDGVQTFVVSDATDATLGRFTIVCGEPLADDLRAEISLLRAELDILKRSFRRHCSES